MTKFLDFHGSAGELANEMLVTGLGSAVVFGLWWLVCRLFVWLGWESLGRIVHHGLFAVALVFVLGMILAFKQEAAAVSYGAFVLDTCLVAAFFLLVRGEFSTVWMLVALVGLAIWGVTQTPPYKAMEERKRAAAAEAKRRQLEKAANLKAKMEAARKAALEANERRLAEVAKEVEAARSSQPDPAIADEILSDMKPVPGRSWRLGKYPVTQRQWAAVMGYNPSKTRGPDNPVDTVSWDDCQRFLERLNGLPAVKKAGVTFRIPTSDEWGYACRAGAKDGILRVMGGREITNGDDTTMQEFEAVGWIWTNSNDKSHPVGEKKPNAFGLHDMLGNVFEWTSSRGSKGRICRGGSYGTEVTYDGFQEKIEIKDDSLRGAKLGFRLCGDGYPLKPLPGWLRSTPEPAMNDDPDDTAEEELPKSDDSEIPSEVEDVPEFAGDDSEVSSEEEDPAESFKTPEERRRAVHSLAELMSHPEWYSDSEEDPE